MTARLPLVLRDGPAVVAYTLIGGTRDRLRWWMLMLPVGARGGVLDDDERDYVGARVEADFRARRADWCDRKLARPIERGNAA